MSETAKRVRGLVWSRGYYHPHDFSDDELKQVVASAFYNYERTLGEKWPPDAIERAANWVCETCNAEARPWSAAFTHTVIDNAIAAEEANLRAATCDTPSAS